MLREVRCESLVTTAVAWGRGGDSRGRVELDLASAGVCLFLYGHSDEQLGISETAVNI